jgi:hypothetical protein
MGLQIWGLHLNVIEIFPELLVFDHFPQIAVGGSNDPDIDFNG